MRTIHWSHARFLVVQLVLTSSIASAADCDSLLAGGVWETTNVGQSEVTNVSFLNWFCSKSFSSSQQLRDSGVSGSVIYEGVPINVGGYSKDSSWKQYSQELCRMNAGRFIHVTELSVAVTRASEALVNAYNNCRNSEYGLLASYVLGPDAREFAVDLSYRGTQAGQSKVTINKFQVTPGKPTAWCDAKTPLMLNGSEKFRCHRDKRSTAVEIVVNGKNIAKQPAALSIAAITPPPPNPCNGAPYDKHDSRSGDGEADIEITTGECSATIHLKATASAHAADSGYVDVRIYHGDGESEQLCYNTTGTNQDHDMSVNCEVPAYAMTPFSTTKFRAVQKNHGDTVGTRISADW